MIRERIACAYPGMATVGLSFWTLDDKTIRDVAVGSASAAAVNGVLERFDPDILVIEGGKRTGAPAGPFRATARTIELAHPGWKSAPLRAPQGRLGYLAHNAWRMGFHHLVRRGPYFIGAMTPVPLTPEWLETHGPPRRARER